MFHIGRYHIDSKVVLAPMAGVTDQPFRQICREMGAGLVVSEMITSDTRLWNSRKSQTRLAHCDNVEPRAVQIAGSDPRMMAEAARMNVDRGAQIIDINMGCPAKKVCKKAAGSALLRDESLVADILQQVCASTEVPVTLKIRTGWSPTERNAVRIARIAEDAGIQALTVHGRTRACRFKGEAEYDTIAQVVQSVSIPVIANGDITSSETASKVLQHTGAAAVMIGRAAQGRPWIFREINHFLQTGEHLPAPNSHTIKTLLLRHLTALHDFYGEFMGLRIARKHVGWYLQSLAETSEFKQQFNQLESAEQQHHYLQTFFDQLNENNEEQAA